MWAKVIFCNCLNFFFHIIFTLKRDNVSTAYFHDCICSVVLRSNVSNVRINIEVKEKRRAHTFKETAVTGRKKKRWLGEEGGAVFWTGADH